MSRYWMRNRRVKVALLVAALMMTLAIYGIVQADPLPASRAAATTDGATTTEGAATAPTPVDGPSEQAAPASGDGETDTGSTVPVSPPMPQSRRSHGS